MCFPGMVTQMIGVGEQTGAMDAMLQKIADFYEDEVDAAVKDLLTAMEPIMIVFLGVVVGGIVISMYLPLFSLIGKLGGPLTRERCFGCHGGGAGGSCRRSCRRTAALQRVRCTEKRCQDARSVGTSEMELTPSMSEWLPWLARVRFLDHVSCWRSSSPSAS